MARRQVIAALLALGLFAGVAYLGLARPPIVSYVEDRLRNTTPIEAPIGDITPTRDLRGTWVSSLPGKGLELFGQYTAGDATVTVYQDGDIELQIEALEGNTAVGYMRLFNVCTSGLVAGPQGSSAIPETCMDTGVQPIVIHVTGSRLDFGTITAGGVTTTMQGNYTADLISGTVSAPLPPYGKIEGLFHLMRQP